MEPRIPVRGGVDAEEAGERHPQARLLRRLTDGARLRRLAVLDEAAGDGPAAGRVLAAHEHDRLPPLFQAPDEDIRRRERRDARRKLDAAAGTGDAAFHRQPPRI